VVADRLLVGCIHRSLVDALLPREIQIALGGDARVLPAVYFDKFLAGVFDLHHEGPVDSEVILQINEGLYL